MKKMLTFFVIGMALFLLGMILVGCTKADEKVPAPSTKPTQQNDEQSILEETWNQLSRDEKAEMSTSWEEGVIEKKQISEEMASQFSWEEGYDNKEVYLVTFKSEKRDFIGDIQKLIDEDTMKIVGYSLRD